MRTKLTVTIAVAALLGGISFARTRAEAARPSSLPSRAALRQALVAAPNTGGTAGGLFGGSRMWAATVNRAGQVVTYVTSTAEPTDVWPGSEAIAKAKAYTANAFSLDTLALSTAMLYTLTQPGHSLSSLGQSNPFDPAALSYGARQGQDQKVAGGLIFFGGGVPLYKDGKIIGGLGISGDTASCDHEIAKRVRDLLGLNPPGGPFVDDISYTAVDGASVFTHPLSLNTFRNGVFIGNVAPATGY